MKKLLKFLLNKTNYRIINIGRGTRNIAEKIPISENTWQVIRPNTMLSELRLANISESIEYLVANAIEGDIVECGIWKGGSVALMAHTLLSKRETRHLHLFDIFDDICEPDAAVDGERAVREAGGIEHALGRLIPVKGIYNNKKTGGAGDEAAVYQLIVNQMSYPAPFVHLHKGWFQETLPLVKKDIAGIALLRLDGDWYASTKVCLEHLYDKVVTGGVIIVDDYGAYDGCRKAVDEYCRANNIHPLHAYVDSECIFWIKTASASQGR